jgi:DNA-binding transcriptional MerR regulator
MFDDLRKLQGQEFDLEALVEAVNHQLKQAGWAPQDERAAERLDPRNVRYYQTLGLVSKPTRYEGRHARYEYRHLLQLVAIKGLQAQGLSLAQIQAWLPAQPVEGLQVALAGSLGERAEIRVLESRELPAPPPQAAGVIRQPEALYSPSPMPQGAAEPAGLAAFRLAPGVTLLIDPSLVADPGGLAARVKNLLEETR